MPHLDALVARIYAASASSDRWPGALEAIGALVGAAGGVILVQREEDWTGWRFSSSLTMGAQTYLSSRSERSQVSSRLLRLNHPGFVTEDAAFPDHREYLADPLMSDWGTPAGLHHAALTAIPMATGESLIIQLNRRKGLPQFSLKDLRFLDAVRPHFVHAGLLATCLRAERSQAAADALSLIGLPAIVIDQNRKVIAANDLVDALESYMDWAPAGHVGLRDIEANALMTQALREITLPSAKSPRSFPAKNHQAVPVVVHLVPTAGSEPDLFGGAYAFVLFTKIADPRAPESGLLRQLFCLTTAEARVAAAVTEGLSLPQIAHSHNVSVETVRAQIKSIFSKTGVNSQSQLAARLAAQRIFPLNDGRER